MTAPTTLDMAEIAAELRQALEDHERVCYAIGGDRRTGEVGAEATYKLAHLKAHATSTTIHPDRKVREHEVAADEASFQEWAALNALIYERRALTERMHSLRQILSAWQTQARSERDGL